MSSSQTEQKTYEVRLFCPPSEAEQVELLSEFLWSLEGIFAIEEHYNPESETRPADTSVDDTVIPVELASLQAFGHTPDLAEQVQNLLIETGLDKAGFHILSNSTIADEDWAESWKQHWDITPISDRLSICPSWLRAGDEDSSADSNKVIIQLDPGAAFGTGTHATTKLMLQALERLSDQEHLGQKYIVDVGTGSGILAIYASLLGAKSITAVDCDPRSVEATKCNAAMNGVGSHISVSNTPLFELCLTPVDLMLANIIAPIILELMPAMAERQKPGGQLLLSGLVANNLHEIKTALTQHQYELLNTAQEGAWYCLHARKQ